MSQFNANDATSVLLESAHEAVNARHAQTRTRLLQEISHHDVRRVVPQRHSSTWRWTLRALGAGGIAASVALAVWFLNTTSPAMAMERLATALAQVTSYTYRMEAESVSQLGSGKSVREVHVGRWRTDPVGLHATTHIVETLDTHTKSPGKRNTLVDLEEAHHAGNRGIIIDHLKKVYWWINEELDADSIGNPLVAIYMVQQRLGRIVRDLGEKELSGRRARGLVIHLDSKAEGPLGQAVTDMEWKDVDMEVWIDLKTDLPIEFHFTRAGDGWEKTYRFVDLRWNVEFSRGAFTTTVPAGYTELSESPYAAEE